MFHDQRSRGKDFTLTGVGANIVEVWFDQIRQIQIRSKNSLFSIFMFSQNLILSIYNFSVYVVLLLLVVCRITFHWYTCLVWLLQSAVLAEKLKS